MTITAELLNEQIRQFEAQRLDAVLVQAKAEAGIQVCQHLIKLLEEPPES